MLQPMQNLFPIVYNLINRFALGNVYGDDYFPNLWKRKMWAGDFGHL